jgi:hypothetical protein
MKVSIGKQVSGLRKDKDSKELPLDFYNLSKCMTISLELDGNDTVAELTLEKLYGNRFVKILDRWIRVQKESIKKEFEEEQQKAVVFERIQFAIKNHNYCRKVNQRVPFYRFRADYSDGSCEFYYFTVRNGGSTDYAKYREDLAYYIGPVNSKAEAIERFNQRFGSDASDMSDDLTVTDTLPNTGSTVPIQDNDDINISEVSTIISDDIKSDLTTESVMFPIETGFYGSHDAINTSEVIAIPTNNINTSPLRDSEWNIKKEASSYTEGYLNFNSFEVNQNYFFDSNYMTNQELESSDDQQFRKRDFSSISTEFESNCFSNETELDLIFEHRLPNYEFEMSDLLGNSDDVFPSRKRKKKIKTTRRVYLLLNYMLKREYPSICSK